MRVRYYTTLAFFVVLSAASYSLQWDIKVYQWVHQTDLSDNVFWSCITLIGNLHYQLLVLGIAVCVFYWAKQKIAVRQTIAIGVTLMATEALVQLLKLAFGRPRPYMFPQYYDFQWLEGAYDFRGFPSGHTATAVALALILSQLFPRWRFLFIFVAVLVGVSRLALDKHWLADILLSVALGGLFAYLVFPELQKNVSKLYSRCSKNLSS